MRSSRFTILIAAVFAAGLGGGAWVQHRWPLGRMHARASVRPEVATTNVADVARLSTQRRLVLLVVGQSNAANTVSTRASGGAGVYAFADGTLYIATDPLPGGDGAHGSVWTRLGARIRDTHAFDAVVIAVAARGSTAVTDWAPGGSCHGQMDRTLSALVAAGLPPDFVLWHQGETEGRSPVASGEDYSKSLRHIYEFFRRRVPGTRFVAARATRHGADPANEQIRIAQAALSRLPGTLLGPDMDCLGDAFRADGVHFNSEGARAAAELWHASLSAALHEQTVTAPSQ